MDEEEQRRRLWFELYGDMIPEKIVDTMIGEDGKRYYKVQWASTTIESSKNFLEAEHLIEKYWDPIEKRLKLPSKESRITDFNDVSDDLQSISCSSNDLIYEVNLSTPKTEHLKIDEPVDISGSPLNTKQSDETTLQMNFVNTFDLGDQNIPNTDSYCGKDDRESTSLVQAMVPVAKMSNKILPTVENSIEDAENRDESSEASCDNFFFPSANITVENHETCVKSNTTTESCEVCVKANVENDNFNKNLKRHIIEAEVSYKKKK